MAARKENPTKIKALIGARVAELRRARGWTQEKMAEKLGTSIQWLSRIEGGAENPTIETLVLFASTLGVPVVELLTGPVDDGGTRKLRSRGRPKKTVT